MKKLAILFNIFFALTAFGITTNERVTLTITVTNTPVTSNTLVFNGVTREWTNADSATTILTNLQGTAWATTNLFSNIASYSYAGGPWTLRYAATNSMQVVGPVGSAITASAAGNWCSLTYSTQNVVRTRSVLYPFDALYSTNATDQASEIVKGINASSTNAFATNATAMGNFLRKTNGYATNVVLDVPRFTNSINYGNAFSSPGTNGTASEEFGSGALANANYALAVGANSVATNAYATAVGPYAIANSQASALGYAATASGANSVSIGSGSTSTAGSSIAIGSGAEATHTNAFAIGTSVTTTRTNEIRLGGSQDVVIGGLLSVEGTLTNNSARITGGTLTNVAVAASAATVTSLVAHAAQLTNANIHAASLTATNPTILSGSATNTILDRTFQTNSTFAGSVTAGGGWAFPARLISSLADGPNYAVPFGSNVFVRLTGTLTATATIYGIVGAGTIGGANGQWCIMLNDTGQNVDLAHNSGDPTAENRISCPGGATLTVSNGYSAQFIYDSSSSLWRVLKRSF